ncbi:MAG TPA: ABC transporter permease [Candidatus Hungatella pullicola]|nr:ABC transporter permease [Candidatus Hungatella pullicola]
MTLYEENKEKYDSIPADKFVLVQKNERLHDSEFKTKPIGFFKDVMLRFAKNKASVCAAVIILIISFFAVFGPGMNEYKYDEQHTDRINMPPKIPAIAKLGLGIFDGGFVLENRNYDNINDTTKYPEGCILKVKNPRLVNGQRMVDLEVDYYKYVGMADDECYWFGSDYLGRDIWTRMWRGARISLIIAVVSVACNVVIGVVYGSIAGYYGGKADMIMMRITEIINAFPRIVIVTLFIMVAGTGMFSIIMSLVIKDWVNTARMVRSQFYRFKGREYVLAARTLGVKDIALIFRHILPNSIGPIITSSMIAIPTAIFAESFLAYIGLGLQAPEPSIGVMLSQGQKVLLLYPTQVVFPAIIISLLMISFNLFGNGLRDAFDPTLRGAE